MTAHVLLSPEAWSQVRDAYAAGDTAEALCARHGVSRSQLFGRARAEGWRRADLEAPPLDAAPFDPGAAAPDPAALAEQAFRRSAHAVANGRLAEARRWLQLHREFGALAEAQAEDAAAQARREAWREIEAMRVAADEPRPTAEPAAAAGETHQTHRTHAFRDLPDAEFMRLGKRALRRARARAAG